MGCLVHSAGGNHVVATPPCQNGCTVKIASTGAEQEFLPLEDLAQVQALRARLLERGHGRAKVAGCVDFLLGIQGGLDACAKDPTSRSTYRKMLHDLLEHDGPKGGGRRVSSRAKGGYVSSHRRRPPRRATAAALEAA